MSRVWRGWYLLAAVQTKAELFSDLQSQVECLRCKVEWRSWRHGLGVHPSSPVFVPRDFKRLPQFHGQDVVEQGEQCKSNMEEMLREEAIYILDICEQQLIQTLRSLPVCVFVFVRVYVCVSVCERERD